MSAAIAPISVNQPDVKYFSEGDILRRRVFAEIAGITKQLEGSGLNDELTGLIQNWKKSFKTSLANYRNTQQVINQFVRLMQELLKDPLSNAPLDQNSVLGSDGRTYGDMSLSLHLNSVPAAYKNRSPLDPNNQSVFTTVPHSNVQYMVSWLESHHALLHDATIERQYRQLVNQHHVNPPSVASALDKIQRIKQRAAAFNKEKEEKSKKLEEHMENRLNLFSQSAAAIAQNQSQNMAALSNRIANAGQNFDAQMQQLNGVLNQLDQNIRQAEVDHEALNKEIAEVQSGIRKGELEDLLLRQQIHELELEMKKKKNEWVKDLAAALIVVGACAFATFAVTTILAASGSSVSGAVLPTLSKGIKLGITLTL